MADRFPLILNTNANQIQEIASGDTLDLTGTNIKGVGIITATNLSGNITAGAGTSSVVAGVGTFTDLRVGGNTTFSEDLVVTGNARVTGILTVGTSSIILNDSANTIKVGTALTLGHTQGLQFHTQNLHSLGFEVNQINASGVITATTFKGDGDFVELDVDGHTNLDNVSIAGVTTIATNTTIGGNLTVNGTNTILNTTTYVQGGEGADGILAIYADEGDDNADKWRLRSGTNGAFYIDNYANGAWQANLAATATSTQLYSAGNIKLNTTTNGINVYNGESGGTTTINVTKGSGDAEVVCQRTGGSGIKLRGSHPVSFLETTTDSDLRIRRNTDTRITLGSSGNTIAGNTTFSGNVSGVNGVFSGNLSVGGVLTYEDVTNVDSVGIITARTSIKAINASANAGNYLEIKTNADSSSDIIKAGAGAFFIKGHNIYIGDDDSNKVYMGGEKDGKSFLKFNNSTKIETTNTGVVATGILTATSFSGGGLKLKDDGADSPILSVMADDGSPWAFQIGNSTYHDSMSTGTMIYNADTGVGYFNHRGNGAYTQFEFAVNNGSATHRCIVFEPSDQSVELYCTNNKKLETTSSGVTVSGNVVATGNVSVNDNNYLYLGNSGDLNLRFLNGTGAFIQSGGNSMFIRSNLIELGDNSGNKYIKCVDGAQVELYHGVNAKKFETTSSGCTLQGTLTAQNTGYGSGSSNIEIQPYGQRGYINWTGTDNFYFRTGSSFATRWIIDGNGHFKPGDNNTYDFGSTALRWRNIYTNDLNLSNKGSTNSVDNTWGDYTIQEGESDLFLINNRSGKKYKFNLTEVS